MTKNADELDTPVAPGRPRDDRIDAAIRDAVAGLLVEVGYRGLTMSAVAERAETTKTALYRRWSGKSELVHDVAFPPATTLPPTTGDVAGDIRTMIVVARDLFASPVTRAALPGLIVDMSADPELAARVHGRFAEAFGAVHARLTAAIASGEVRPEIDADRLVEVMGGAAMLRLLLHPDTELDDSWVDHLWVLTLRGVRNESPTDP